MQIVTIYDMLSLYHPKKQEGSILSFPRLLIVNSSAAFCRAAAEALASFAVTESCHSGPQALELLRSGRFDLLLLDLALPHMDGLAVLRQAQKDGIFPATLVTMDYQSAYIFSALTALDVSYAVLKPCPMEMLAMHMQDIAATLSQDGHEKAPLQTDPVAIALSRLGVRSNLSGSQYLKDAIPLFAGDPGQLITKELYANVGKPYGKNSQQVERAMRNAIELAWIEGNRSAWQQYFPDCANARPANRSFIARFAQLLCPQEQQIAG